MPAGPRLTNKDYIDILQFYKMTIPKSKRLVQFQAEKIMAEKLCKCIKKIDTKYEPKAISICSKSVFNNKGLTRGKFSCKTKRFVTFKKMARNKTYKKNR